MSNVEGRNALVTGASTGIGQAIAIRLAEAGCSVAITGRSEARLKETADLCRRAGGAVTTRALDVRDLDQIAGVTKELLSELGRVDILVNNAGINRPAPTQDVDRDNWDDLFNTNVRGGFFCAQALLPAMARNGFGRVIFISSQSGLVGIRGQSVYCASKGALINLARALGVEWAEYGITVNAVAPTFIDTELTRERLNDPEFRRSVLTKIPKGELATVADVAYAVLYLASEQSGMVNCATLPVDGGWTAW